MKLRIDGEINRTYVQNLCLIFFPGAKFPENEPENSGTPTLYLTVRDDGETVFSDAVIEDCGKKESGNGKIRISECKSAERAYKLSAGDAVLEACGKLLGKLPPWGILTGVRPAKIGREMKASGLDKAGIAAALRDEFRVSDPKAKLLAEITEVEARAASLAEEDTCSLYVSIPFCPTRCAYCSFVSYSTPRYLSMIPDYLDALCKDINEITEKIKESGKRLLTVYVGGGTPTVLDAGQLDRLLGVINDGTKGYSLLEFTVEAGRPDTVTDEKFKVMLSHGVDRTSINPQILDDGILQKIGRRHTVDDFYRAYEVAKRSGIRSINTDLIAGLPGSDIDIFRDTVDRITGLSPENVTVHTYCVKRSAEFTEQAAEQGDKLGIYSYTGGDTAQCVEYAQTALMKDGYLPYYMYRQKNAQGNLENVGFAKPGCEGLYNIFIMEELQDIYAVGAGAVTKLINRDGGKITRIFEPKYTYEYLKGKN